MPYQPPEGAVPPEHRVEEFEFLIGCGVGVYQALRQMKCTASVMQRALSEDGNHESLRRLLSRATISIDHNSIAANNDVLMLTCTKCGYTYSITVPHPPKQCAYVQEHGRAPAHISSKRRTAA